MRVVGVLLVGVMMYSCSEPAVDEISSENLKSKWENSLYNAMHIVECKTLSLEGYKYLGDVTTEVEKQALLDEIFGLDEYMVVANYKTNIFKVLTYGRYVDFLSTKNKSLYAPRRNNVASAIVDRNIGVVELRWVYLGKEFTSKAIVATDGEKEFIYDNILTYAPIDNQPVGKSEDVITRSGNSGEIVSIFSDHGPMTLSLEYAWEYEIQLISYFDSNKIFSGSDSSVNCSAAIGWDCAADVMTVSGEVGKTNYHEFMVGYAYGEGIDVSITHGGLGLNILAPPGATSGSFVVMHHANQLHD